MSENIIVPEYLKKEMEKPNNLEQKKYGTTVFDYIPEEDKETIANDFFAKDEYNSDEIEKQREELKETYDGSKVSEVISKDALSGITSSTPENSYTKEDYDALNETLEENNIRGKSISKYGKALIKSLLNSDPTDDETLLLATKFEEYKDRISTDTANKARFDELSIKEIEEFLSDRIKNQIKELCEDSGTYKEVAARFLEQIYITYNNTISYRDDIKELNDLALEIDKSGLLKDDFDSTNDPKSFDFMNDKITKYMEAIKRLDDRNRMLKQDYKISDIDTLILESAKICLDNAINFTKVKNKIDNAVKKFKNDLKNSKDSDSRIENWIHDIKHDSTTLFTFPCNDFLTDSESREELTKFFYNAYLVDIVYNKNIDVPAEDNIDDYLITNNILANKDLDTLKRKAYVMLYMISRTFKYNKVKDNDENIRTLSYTLDIISKLGVKSHRDKFIEASDYVYNKIYG